MVESIAKTLGSGSGIDLQALVTELVTAQTEVKTNALTKRSETLEAQISATATLKSSISTFDSALKTLIRGGTLATQPTSSNPSILKASTLTGQSAAGVSGTIEVRQLAQAQSTSSTPVADKSAAIGRGTLTLTFGTATVSNGAMTAFTPGAGTPVTINITSANSSLQGIADAINAKNAGVTASILSDADGSRLVLKGATGAAQAFTLSATETPGHEGLAALAVGQNATGTTIGSTAQDALVAVDGVQLRRASNTIDDLVPGVRLDLVSAAVGTRVTLGSEAPTTALSQAVGDVVDTYNEIYAQLKEATDPVDGPLRADPAAKALLRSLSDLTTRILASGTAGSPRTLSEIGVITNRDGTLKLDQAKLTSALTNYPSSVETMFKLGGGLSAQLSLIATTATGTISGLGASETRYARAKTQLTEDQTKATAAAEALRTRMTRQFATMDAMVASYKSTQTFLENQVKAWNSDS